MKQKRSGPNQYHTKQSTGGGQGGTNSRYSLDQYGKPAGKNKNLKDDRQLAELEKPREYRDDRRDERRDYRERIPNQDRGDIRENKHQGQYYISKQQSNNYDKPVHNFLSVNDMANQHKKHTSMKQSRAPQSSQSQHEQYYQDPRDARPNPNHKHHPTRS